MDGPARSKIQTLWATLCAAYNLRFPIFSTEGEAFPGNEEVGQEGDFRFPSGFGCHPDTPCPTLDEKRLARRGLETVAVQVQLGFDDGRIALLGAEDHAVAALVAKLGKQQVLLASI
jgi:hypothetical protein